MKRVDDWQVSDEAARRFLLECRDSARRIDPHAEVILFGSRARGEGSAESDYDLLVLCEGDVSACLRQRVRDALYDVGLKYDVVASVFVYSRRQWDSPPWRATPLHERVEEEGVLI